MRILEITYSAFGNQRFVYYKAETPESFSENTKVYKTYTDCRDEVNAFSEGDIEFGRIKAAMLQHYNKTNTHGK